MTDLAMDSGAATPTTAAAIEAFINSKYAAGCAAKTIGKLRYGLHFLENEFPATLPVALQDLESFFARLRSRTTLGDTTRNNIFAWVKQFYAFCRGRYGIPSPFEIPASAGGLKRPKLRRKDIPSFSREEVLRILAANQGNPQRYAALCLMLDTGLRPGEAFGLRRADIRGGYIIVRGKMGEERQPLTDKARAALLRWMTVHAGTALWTPRTQHGFKEMLERAFKAAGVKGFPYMLRHTTATLLTDAGVSAFDVKQVMRHSNMRMTERYVEQSKTRAADALRRYGPLSDWEESYFQRSLRLLDDTEETASG